MGIQEEGRWVERGRRRGSCGQAAGGEDGGVMYCKKHIYIVVARHEDHSSMHFLYDEEVKLEN
jgi:hypothetical protein